MVATRSARSARSTNSTRSTRSTALPNPSGVQHIIQARRAQRAVQRIKERPVDAEEELIQSQQAVKDTEEGLYDEFYSSIDEYALLALLEQEEKEEKKSESEEERKLEERKARKTGIAAEIGCRECLNIGCSSQYKCICPSLEQPAPATPPPPVYQSQSSEKMNEAYVHYEAAPINCPRCFAELLFDVEPLNIKLWRAEKINDRQ
ncbi:hypothetical protein BCR41DRAFT_403981 [Lobosporangium transversale]|uniref:Uncharacterized protein n=1 Tax=Lobosporangium transversale TaxID=64571 RepID=A0A1Y2FYN4_9FUNG|nr:hypothetical protein BCR41DRAFT_403981 [Lobosporangium transversale]ORY89187.1 hypothetical protein BCR41DRAFT_403981 [Lobosporangium transversale]|eukprot:XP_021875042.1 hypothetical protein BCR41DRAFT_403981 [Lobosporangium transversale]